MSLSRRMSMARMPRAPRRGLKKAATTAATGLITVLGPNGQPAPEQQQWANKVVPQFKRTIHLVPDPDMHYVNPRGGGLATNPQGDIYYRPGAFFGGEWMFDHELGHQFDYSQLKDPWRKDLSTVMGMEGKAWGEPVGTTPENYTWNTPQEQFANTYADLALPGLVMSPQQKFIKWMLSKYAQANAPRPAASLRRSHRRR